MELDGSTEASDQAAMAFAVLSVALCCTMWLLTEVNVAKAAGVFLTFLGETLPSDSIVDLDDVLNTGGLPDPSNREPASANASLQCITDLVDCCGTESGTVRTERGNWYFPDGTTVGFGSGARFLESRGPNEVIGEQQFNGSVRLFRRFSGVTERGRFRCELPNAASVNQILYVNILNFASHFNDPHIIISSSGSNTARMVYSLNCSSTLRSDSSPLPDNVPAPTFIWFFGPSGSDPLPSGVTDMGTTSSDNNTFTSTLQFSSLSQCHIGNYTCRLGPGRLVASTMVTVNELSPITQNVEITASGAKVLGQNYSLICNVTVTGTDAANPSIAYKWTKRNNGTQAQVGTDRVLSFSPLRLSNAGRYTCQATITSPCNIIEMDTEDVTLQTPSISVLITSSGAPILGQSNYFLTCTANGTGPLDPTINTYQWTKNNGTNIGSEQILGENSAILPFSNPLKLSDAGQYTCQVNASYNSLYLDEILVVEDLDTLNITLEMPNATSIVITSSQANPIRPIGSTVTLTCTVGLSPLVDILVTVNTEWTGPDGFTTINTAQPVMGSTNYTSTAMVSSFGREQSGNYTCNSSIFVNPSIRNSFILPGINSSAIIRLTVGVYLSLRGMVYANNSVIPITEIGQTTSSTGLQCITDSMFCCAQWLLPDRTTVQNLTDDHNRFYTNKSTDGTAILYRANDTIMAPAGLFCCQVPDAPIPAENYQEMCINIVSIQITGSAPTPHLGQTFSLTCNISGADVITYEWVKNGSYSLNETGSILSFTPLKLSNAGQYTCIVNISSEMFNTSQSIIIRVPGPTNVSITSDQDNPIRPIGSTVNVTCVACIDLSNRPEIDILLTIDMVIELIGQERIPLKDTSKSFTVLQSNHTYNSTATISSFGRNRSGSYKCTINITTSTTPTIFLVEHTNSKSVHITTDVGVYLLRGETVYSNNSLIFIEETTKLQCITDRMPCCATPPNRVGQWQFPNQTNVGISGTTTSFYRDRGDDGTVNLNRDDDGIIITGLFCCMVPDADDIINQTLCISIVAVNLTDNGATPVLGGVYALNCSVYNTSMTTFQWKKDDDVLQNVSEQLLSFPKLSLSDAGYYTCIVNRNGVMHNSSQAIILHVPRPASVTIRSDPIYPIILGSTVINCVVELDQFVVESELSLLMVDAQLSRDGTPLNLFNVTISGTTITYATMINSFGRNESGNYTCIANVGSNSSYLYGNTSGSISVSISYHELEMDQSPTSTVGVILGVLFVIAFLILGSALAVAVGLRKKLKVKVLNLKSQRPRQYLGDHDYVTHAMEPHQHQEGHGKNYYSEGESLELNENEETQTDKDKDYYFMDTTLIAGECVKPIPVSEFSSHIERLHADRDKLFEMEYESVSKHPQSSYSVAEIPHNKLKNRFANIFPYDSSRVKLEEILGEDGSDYINASHLDGYNKPKAYIGAQGPMSNTLSDFWRMIWEKKLPTVVMLTRVFEGRKKCEEYWPLNIGESVQPGHGLTITLTSTLPFAEYSLRKMTLTCSTAPGSAPLKVTQYHFTGWPDHGVPQNGVTLINFIRRVRTSHPYSDSRPLLVHCSAGVGRTGAFIVLDSMLQRMQGEQNLNIYEFFKQLRAQRVLMVQTQAQYNFIHDALNELILCGDTEITAPNLRIVISRLNKTTDGETGYTKQFNLIAQMSPGYSESDYTQASMECNLSKNRYPNILPNDCHRVLLRAAAGSDYINASFIDGYRQRGGYIATQAPMENTVNDFWRMVWDYQSRAIVMLCRMKEDGKEACCPFLPEHKGDSEVYGKIRVKLVSKETTTDYVIQQLEVSEDKPHPQGHASSETVVKVGVFHYIRWPKHGTPRGTAALLDLIQHINKTQMTSGNKPITVMCNDGVGRTGTFICIHAQLERLKTEGVVDFFQSIKSARIQRAGLVPDVHQYILCHNLVADYLDGFDTYANFKELV